MIRANGTWGSDMRVEGATSRIIEKRGTASGTWSVKDQDLVLSVEASDMEVLWEKGVSFSCRILELNGEVLKLQYPNGRLVDWDRTRARPKGPGAQAVSPVIPLEPMVVNLNKIRSADKDRYLCMDLELHLHDLMPDEKLPRVHPRAREAMILYLSSLLYADVKTFDEVKVVVKKLEAILNPHLGGLLREIKINHVVIASSMEKAEEFLIGHMPAPDVEPVQDGEGASEKKKDE
jgi:flagellar basal body-associated protein FliL